MLVLEEIADLANASENLVASCELIPKAARPSTTMLAIVSKSSPVPAANSPMIFMESLI